MGSINLQIKYQKQGIPKTIREKGVERTGNLTPSDTSPGKNWLAFGTGGERFRKESHGTKTRLGTLV